MHTDEILEGIANTLESIEAEVGGIAGGVNKLKKSWLSDAIDSVLIWSWRGAILVTLIEIAKKLR